MSSAKYLDTGSCPVRHSKHKVLNLERLEDPEHLTQDRRERGLREIREAPSGSGQRRETLGAGEDFRVLEIRACENLNKMAPIGS